jgi:hypothetical protein
MAFKRGQDPKKSMGLGYGNKMNTKGWKVLKFIQSFGEEGASLTDIQKFIFVELNGRDEEDFWKKSQGRWDHSQDKWDSKAIGPRASRGYWNTYLYGNGMGAWGGHKEGLLNRYCHKNEKGRWVLDEMPAPGANIFESKLVPSLNEYLNEGYIDI